MKKESKEEKLQKISDAFAQLKESMENKVIFLKKDKSGYLVVDKPDATHFQEVDNKSIHLLVELEDRHNWETIADEEARFDKSQKEYDEWIKREVDTNSFTMSHSRAHQMFDM